jgi:hypothetical protein
MDRTIVDACYETSAVGWKRERADHWELFWKQSGGLTARFQVSVAENLVHFTSNINKNREQLSEDNSQIRCNESFEMGVQ